MPATFKLRLYVHPDNSAQALSLLYKALEYHPYSDYELEIIDVSQSALAVDDGKANTPMLMSVLVDGRKIVSDKLDDIHSVRKDFGFKEKKW